MEIKRKSAQDYSFSQSLQGSTQVGFLLFSREGETEIGFHGYFCIEVREKHSFVVLIN